MRSGSARSPVDLRTCAELVSDEPLLHLRGIRRQVRDDDQGRGFYAPRDATMGHVPERLGSPGFHSALCKQPAGPVKKVPDDRRSSCQGLASLTCNVAHESAANRSPQPIQRICKYPLLFAELLKYTPVSDCAYSHMEVENALMRLREATAEINRATNDARMKATLEKTWILQDRLVFPNQVSFVTGLDDDGELNPEPEARRRFQESNPLFRPHPAVWSTSRLLADERRRQRPVYGVPLVQPGALPGIGREGRPDIYGACLSKP